uniref:Uncharacterized protein n=1 Tax=Plectus sambesii TaxID=2011161 RepID=A0A914XI21_9BILA
MRSTPFEGKKKKGKNKKNENSVRRMQMMSDEFVLTFEWAAWLSGRCLVAGVVHAARTANIAAQTADATLSRAVHKRVSGWRVVVVEAAAAACEFRRLVLAGPDNRLSARLCPPPAPSGTNSVRRPAIKSSALSHSSSRTAVCRVSADVPPLPPSSTRPTAIALSGRCAFSPD